MPWRMTPATDAIPIVGFVATQLGPTGGEFPAGIAGPVGLLVLGVYTTVYVARAVTEMRRNGNAKPQNDAVVAATLKHIETALKDMAQQFRTADARLDAHGDRLTRAEALAESHAMELGRIREEGCQQLQKHFNVLRDIREEPQD